MTTSEREAMLRSAERQVRAMARQLADGFGKRHERDEFEGDAVLFMVESLSRWDPARGASFPTYAVAYARRSLIRKHARPGPREVVSEVIERAEALDEPTPLAPPTVAPNPEQQAVLGAVNEPARTYVRLIRFEGLTPAQVADQFQQPVKDIKLAIRNAYAQMCRLIEQEDRTESLSLFGNIVEE
jgi:RNA polymerase sigma factor (sigma-70 family)